MLAGIGENVGRGRRPSARPRRVRPPRLDRGVRAVDAAELSHPDDFERLAVAANLLGRDDASEAGVGPGLRRLRRPRRPGPSGAVCLLARPRFDASRRGGPRRGMGGSGRAPRRRSRRVRSCGLRAHSPVPRCVDGWRRRRRPRAGDRDGRPRPAHRRSRTAGDGPAQHRRGGVPGRTDRTRAQSLRRGDGVGDARRGVAGARGHRVLRRHRLLHGGGRPAPGCAMDRRPAALVRRPA